MNITNDLGLNGLGKHIFMNNSSLKDMIEIEHMGYI